jgi:hypothetical protein
LRPKVSLDGCPLVRGECRVLRGLGQNGHSSAEEGRSVGRQARSVEPVSGERLGDEAGRRTGEDQADPAVPVRRGGQRLVKAADRQQAAAPDGREPEDEVALEDRCPLILDLEAPVVAVAGSDGPFADLQVGVPR